MTDYSSIEQRVTQALGLTRRPVAVSFRDSAHPTPKGGDLVPLATSVFRDFAFPFEVASVLLLAAMIGAIVLVKRDEGEE